MQEIATKKDFDYSILDDTIAKFLKVKEQELQSIVLNSSIQLGEALIEAQDKLAKYGEGTFVKWFESIGLKRQSVYNYINQCKFFHQMEKVEQIEMFQELPTTLKTEISKPSAKQEAVEMVLSGDIKTTKEFKELERKLKESEERNKRLAEQALKQEVVEKEVVIEKVPEDYQDLKSRVKSTEERNQFLEKNLQELYAKRSEVDEKSAKYDELTEAIKQSQGQLNSYQRRIASYKNFMSLFQKADQLIMEISGLAYSKETQLIDLDGLVKSEFNDLVDRGLKLFNDLDKKRQPQNILEGELL
jgi:chromosome segregation ATPase